MTNAIALWDTMPKAEKLGCIAFAIIFPILITFIAVVLP